MRTVKGLLRELKAQFGGRFDAFRMEYFAIAPPVGRPEGREIAINIYSKWYTRRGKLYYRSGMPGERYLREVAWESMSDEDLVRMERLIASQLRS